MTGQRGRRRAGAILILCLGVFLTGGKCNTGSGTALTIGVGLNSVASSLATLLIVPPSGFVVNVSFGGATPDLGTLEVQAIPWSGGPATDLTSLMNVDASGGYAVVPPSHALAAPSSYTLFVSVRDTQGLLAARTFDFAVRNFPSGPPIGTGQLVWYDFAADRNGDTEPDFAADLRAVGLGSLADPVLSAQVEGDVIAALVARVESAYHDEDPNGLGGDAANLTFVTEDPGPVEVTRICVGGVAPGYPTLIGSILIDPNNQNRASVECSTIPPTGVFAGGLLNGYGNSTFFQAAFDPLMTSRGGTPVGEHPLDPIVLDPGFDYGAASSEEQQRFDEIQTGIQRFAEALGSVVAHETGHAVGLVAPGAPGVGLHGGQSGYAFSHDVEADGTTPAPNYMMKAGNTFNFQKLAGVAGHPLPFFRPLDHAWLRDRAVTDPTLSQLLPPPIVTNATPQLVTGDGFLTVTGNNFVATPKLTLWSFGFQYELILVSWISSTEVRGLISYSQVLPGTYLLMVENPDQQMTIAPVGITVE